MSDVFGKRLGQYVLLEQLGEGGMAKVYNALDSRAERNVAIKVILPSKQSSQVFIQQFEQEAKSLANLIHTNIVKVLNYGVENGQPYLVMEFIPGGTLKDAMQRPIPWQTAAAILAPIARALEYVHRQQIVHRDVKPSNILLDEEYHPMLSDFGIVKLLEAKDEGSTATIGVGVGTPDYMSPEQGMGKDVDFRADIYSLGLVYYEMVTGHKPFTADTPMAAVLRHITDELVRPTALDKKIPRFVEAAILRAVEKNPQDRYASMSEFAEALELIALGKEAPARKILQLTQKQKTKRKFQSKYLLSLLIPLVLGLAFFAYRYSNRKASAPPPPPTAAGTVNAPTQTQPTKTASPTATAKPAEEPTTAVVESSGPAEMDTESGIRLMDVPLERPGSAFEPVALWGLGGVNRVKWSPDGSRIALGTTSGVFVYDSGSRQLQRYIFTAYNVIEIAFNPTGDRILAASADGQVNVWDLGTGKLVDSIGNTTAAKVNAIAYSSNNKNMAIAYEDGLIQYYQVGQKAPLMSINQPQSAKAVAISTDNRYMYVSNGENKIVIWDIAARKIDSEWTSTVPIDKLDMSKDGQYIISAGNGNAVSLWDLFEGRVVSSFSGLGGKVTDIEFSNDDKLVVIGLSNGTIQIFARPAPEEYSKAQSPLVTIQGLSESVRSLALSPDQRLVAAGNWMDGAKLWDAKTGEEAFTFEGHMRGVDNLYFSPDGTWLVTAHEDEVVRIWDVKSAHETYQFKGYLPKGQPFSSDNRFLTMIRTSPVRYQADLVDVIELSSGKIVAELPGYEDTYLVEFTDDTKLLIVGDDHHASFWDVSTWEQLSVQGGMNAGCGQYFTPPNNLLAVIYDTGVLFSYDDKIQELCGKKPQGTTLVYYFEADHDVFFVLGDGNVWSWDFADSDIANIHSSAPYPFPDQIFLAADQESGWYAYARDARILVQKNPEREPGWNLQYQDDYQYRVALLPGKHLMALGSRYGSIHIWTMP